jgi:hypothetical protein
MQFRYMFDKLCYSSLKTLAAVGLEQGGPTPVVRETSAV